MSSGKSSTSSLIQARAIEKSQRTQTTCISSQRDMLALHWITQPNDWLGFAHYRSRFWIQLSSRRWAVRVPITIVILLLLSIVIRRRAGIVLLIVCIRELTAWWSWCRCAATSALCPTVGRATSPCASDGPISTSASRCGRGSSAGAIGCPRSTSRSAGRSVRYAASPPSCKTNRNKRHKVNTKASQV